MVQITLLVRHGAVVAACLTEQERDVTSLVPNVVPHAKKVEFAPAVMVKGSVIRAEKMRGEWMLIVDLPENLPHGKDIPFIVVSDGDMLGAVAAAMDKRKVVEMDIEEGGRDRRGRLGGFGGDFGPAGDSFPDNLDDDLDDIFADLGEDEPILADELDEMIPTSDEPAPEPEDNKDDSDAEEGSEEGQEEAT